VECVVFTGLLQIVHPTKNGRVPAASTIVSIKQITGRNLEEQISVANPCILANNLNIPVYGMKNVTKRANGFKQGLLGVLRKEGAMPQSNIEQELNQISLQKLPRLDLLRRTQFETRPAVCLELARNTTRFMKTLDDSSYSPQVRAGKLYKYIMEQKTPIIADRNLLAGTKTKGVIFYPDFMATAMWPELETLSRRNKNPFDISRLDIDELATKVLPYWVDRTIEQTVRRDNGNPECLKLMERIIFFNAAKVTGLSHTVPDYATVVTEGLRWIIEMAAYKQRQLGGSPDEQQQKDFYQAVQDSLGGIIRYAQNLSKEAARQAQATADPEWRQELITMSDVCAKVPEWPAETFREALNAIWICKAALYQENMDFGLSLGRLDQILYHRFVEDMENKTISLLEAVELVGCLWLKIADHVPPMPEAGEELFGGTGSNQAITLGGVDRAGNDAVNDLTYVMLRVTELLKMRDPNVNARYHPEENSKDYLRRLCEVNINTGATPCFHNDVAVIKMLQGQKVDDSDANDYAIVGCVEPLSAGRSFGHPGAIVFNLPSVLELTLTGGKHERLRDDPDIRPPATKSFRWMKSFAEFKEAFERQLDWLIKQAVTLNNHLGRAHQAVHRTPMLSALIQGCMDQAKDVLEGGAIYNSSGIAVIGLADVVDSVTAIEKFVSFHGTGGLLSPVQMADAINANWEGPFFDGIRDKIRNAKEHFGNDTSALTKKNADWLICHLNDKFQSEENYRGGKYTVGYWSMTYHAGFGRLTGALPSGRRKGDPFASGITPVSGAVPNLTSCLNFVAGLKHEQITNGHALNLKFSPSVWEDPQMIATYLGAFFNPPLEGLQAQSNVIDRAMLLRAKEHPDDEQVRHLLVRVSGYTAYFTDLNPLMQEEVINRQEY